MDYVQGFVTNSNIPRDFEDFCEYILGDYLFPIETVLETDYIEYTAARWCMPNDICFFMFAKTSKEILGMHKASLKREKEAFSIEEYNKLEEGVLIVEELVEKYCGSIFAVGRVSGKNIYDDEVDSYWKSNIYAGIADIVHLDKPVYIAEFRDFLFISRGGVITPVLGEEFEKLKSTISKKNNMPDWFINSHPMKFSLYDNQKNSWHAIGKNFVGGFILEKQLRVYFVDKFLKALSDDNKIFEECECLHHYGDSKVAPRVDYVIKYNNRYLGVETKLSISNEKMINEQLRQYIDLESVLCKGKDLIHSKKEYYQDRILVIDKFGVYMYTCMSGDNKELYETIDEVYSFSGIDDTTDLDYIKGKINSKLSY